MGIIPDNSGASGDVVKASQVFVRSELIPLQERLKEINSWLSEEIMELFKLKNFYIKNHV